ncbi:hypothetical protein KUTeg_008623 [Tegillarca granosa]|uniref:Tubulin polyglutamylase TTLL4 n=1 Tax=Tegillarca granosa TaxID=220873 RepID=A0ABQ9F9M1_TEGGR|nr:hypothetical protein KUTeg_008623 [Tegillarca granosa]
MGDSKLTASLEELSLKKQLPLRQTTAKPTLKYNPPISKQVQLYDHQDLVHIRPDTGRNAYSALSQASSTSPMIHTGYRIGPSPVPTPVCQTHHGPGQNYVSPNNVGKPQSAKGHSNPYARPLSAKDIVSDLLQNQHKIKKTISAVQHSSSSGNINGQTSNGQSTNVFPVNSFMRPQSAVRKEILREINNKEIPAKNDVQKANQSGSKEKLNNPKYADASATSGQRPLVNGSYVSNSSKHKPGSTGPTVIQKVPAPPNFSTQIISTIAKVAEKSAAANQRQETKVVNKTVSSLPKPGSGVASPECPSKVRNLNYTPTKPYAEVMDPSPPPPPQTSNSKQTTSVTAITKSKHKPEQTSATSIVSTPEEKVVKEKPKIAKIMSAPPHLSALPAAHIKGTLDANGTIFYRKESRTEDTLSVHEQRPPAVGAPSKVAKILEKAAAAAAEAYEEDENEEDDESTTETGTPGERLPGDGEASLDGDDDDDYDDEDDDALENLEVDDFDGSDGESDGYSITSSSLSRRSSSARSRAKSARRPIQRSTSATSNEEPKTKVTRPLTAVSDVRAKPALTKSLFPNIPPTITFIAEGERVEQLPWEIRKMLKWRMSPITPNIVKHSLARIGFRITKRNHDWLGCWGKHMKSQAFKSIREYQKLNHFPGSFQIGRKDKLWRNLSKMQVHFGKKEFSFFPQTFVLPTDLKLLKRAWEDGGNKQKWIIKPPASARGIGIKVIHKWNQIPRKRPIIVQRYLSRPYLINDSKFDMRIYVYVSCYDPLRLYIYEDGLARFASCKYSSSMKNLNNKFMHLTNYSVNKKNAEYQSNGDDQVGLKALWNYMKRQGINTTAIWDNIKDLVIKTIVSADSQINSMIKANTRSRYCVHELFGFDIMLDENLKPWILEVNISPSLHSNSQLDINIKGHMIRDLMNIAGFRVPDKADVAHASPSPASNDFSSYVPPTEITLDKRLYTQQCSPDERSKHAYYCQRHQDDQVVQTILDTLTPDDIRVLTESIDEDSRKGGFQRVFPTPNTQKYLRYFETARYGNLLLDQWVQRFNRMEQRGKFITP